VNGYLYDIMLKLSQTKKKYFRASPDNIDFPLMAGIILLKTGNNTKAFELLSKALELDPTHPKVK